MTNLSHAASFHSDERIAPSNHRIKHLVFGAGSAKTFRALVASGTPDATIELRLDRTDVPVIGIFPVADAHASQEKIAAVSDASGVCDPYLIFRGGAPSLVDMDYWRFDCYWNERDDRMKARWIVTAD